MRKYNQELFCQKIQTIHGNKYDLSEFNFVTTKIKGKVKCNVCGAEFYMTPSDLFRKHGCPQCKFNKLKQQFLKTTEQFILELREVHGDKYDYSKVEYKGNKVKVTLICPIHGEFSILPINVLRGQGCGKCFGTKKITQEDFITKAKEVHGDKYDYSKVEYVNRETFVTIICPEHGEFKIAPHKHLIGQGCKKCRRSHLETFVKQWLTENKIVYEEEYKNQWLGKQSLDFYLPMHKIAIECQGIQHLKPISFYGGDEHFEYTKKLDEMKYKKCEENNITLLYVIESKYKPILTSFYFDKKVVTNISNLKEFL